MMIDIEQLARIFKALGDRSRLRILAELLEEPRHVGALVRRTGLQQSLVSHHLKVLRESDLVVARRRGPFVYYEVASEAVRAVLDGATRNTHSRTKKKSGGKR